MTIIFNTPQSILLVTAMILFLAMTQFALTHLTSVGWHKLASVSWNG